VLGIGGGLLLSYSADGMAGHVIGIRPRFVVSPEPLVIGAAITLLVAVGAGLWPAVGVAATTPLRLLQAGRASA